MCTKRTKKTECSATRKCRRKTHNASHHIFVWTRQDSLTSLGRIGSCYASTMPQVTPVDCCAAVRFLGEHRSFRSTGTPCARKEFTHISLRALLVHGSMARAKKILKYFNFFTKGGNC